MKNNSVVFFSYTITNRLKFAAELVFQDLLGLTIHFTHDKYAYLEDKLPKINYSDTPLSINEYFIKKTTLLFESEINADRVGQDYIYFTQQSPLDFDVLEAVFFLVTRYEEYAAKAASFDNHNRFPAKASIAHKFGFLQKPLINQWIMKINAHLKALFPELETTLPTYTYQPTFDIDMPWKYKNKGFVRATGGLVKDFLKGDFVEFKNRLNILRGGIDDPYFTFDYIFELHKTHNVSPIFFLLLGDHAKFDKNPHPDNKAFQQFIYAVAKNYKVGLHPSYRSNECLSVLQKEKSRFERMTQLTLVRSRQHFLKLRFPETYQRLLTLGVKHDYSMGYANDIGFRASIVTPFRWFDLSKNEATDLWIHPFQAMDVTLKDYLNLSPNEAVARVSELINETKAVGGTFMTLWHNSSFSNTEGWENWREVYERILTKAH